MSTPEASETNAKITIFGDVFTNKDKVHGELLLTVARPVKVESITIKCICDRQIRCGNDYCPPGEKREDFSANVWGTNKAPFSIKHFTQCFDQLEFSFDQEVQPGAHGFKFRLRLPQRGGPETFSLEGLYSNYTWYAHASIRFAGSVEEAKTPFTFVPQHEPPEFAATDRKEAEASISFKVKGESKRLLSKSTNVKVDATLSSFKRGLLRPPEAAGVKLNLRCSHASTIKLLSIDVIFGESVITGIRDEKGHLQRTGRNPHLKKRIATYTFDRELRAEESFDEFEKLVIPEVVTGAFEDDLFNYRHMIEAHIQLVPLHGTREPETLKVLLWSGVVPRTPPEPVPGPPLDEEDPPPPYTEGETPASRFGRFINRTFGNYTQPWEAGAC